MKSSILTLIVSLISSASLACGWYPYGEDIRFSLMSPNLFDDGGMSPYYYTSSDYGYMFTATPENDPNVELWKEYCGGNVDENAIFEAVYELSEASVKNRKSSNAMIDYLIENGDTDALNYLAFAKSCSDLNSVDAYWEVENSELKRTEMMLEAVKRSGGVTSPQLTKRYRFLAIRLAYYNNDFDKLKSIYRIAFRKKPQDIIDYWALYFNSCIEPISAKRNFDLIQVFANAPGKRFGALSSISGGISIDDVLAEAKTDKQRANIHIVYAVRNSGRGLNDLKTVYQLGPNNSLINYLLVREINKIEDWVLTPRYTNFDPSMNPKGGTYGLSNELIQERIKDDEKYAMKVRDWLESLNEMPNPTWELAKSYLQGISGKQKEALTILADSKKFPENTQSFVNKLRVLFRASSNRANFAFNESDQAILMNEDQANYNLFLFAVARELEFQHKTDVAAALFTQLNRSEKYYDSSVSWRSPSGKSTLGSDYYYSWFLYIDAEYTPEEVQGVINFTLDQSNEKSPFKRWQNRYLIDNLDRLYDLLGTKYIRENNMSSAITAFQKVEGDLWNSYPYSMYLKANPFHANFYSGHKPSKMDTVRYNKLELVSQYQAYMTKANNPETKNRAYYYFLLGNCELNMSQYGNSWMMRRYFWTRNAHPSHLEDDDEFFRLKRAQQYYQKAYDLATSPEVKALCLRMKGRCEKHELMFDAPDSWDFDYDKYGGKRSYVYAKNQSYKKLISEYPDDAEDLMSNCYSFERYFARLEN